MTAASSNYAVVYNFGTKSNDAATPFGDLLAVNGELYGTSFSGGSSNGCDGGCGTVFKVSPGGTESVLHSFSSGNPAAGLIDLDGQLYGTTSAGGGPSNTGTVFRISTSGAKAAIYSFAGGTDSAEPAARLTDLDGELYGTTNLGGESNSGTVFKVSTSGKESVLHSFSGSTSPLGSLTDVNGELYGTTFAGGTGSGTVFKISPSGAKAAIYSFKGGADGSGPGSPAGITPGGGPGENLVAVNGELYGTTFFGGNGCGTVFKVSTSGAESVVFRFKCGDDGENPAAGLIAVNGELYGVTPTGGTSDPPYGTLFELTLAGHHTVLHNFGAKALEADGYLPVGV